MISDVSIRSVRLPYLLISIRSVRLRVIGRDLFPNLKGQSSRKLQKQSFFVCLFVCLRCQKLARASNQRPQSSKRMLGFLFQCCVSDLIDYKQSLSFLNGQLSEPTRKLPPARRRDARREAKNKGDNFRARSCHSISLPFLRKISDYLQSMDLTTVLKYRGYTCSGVLIEASFVKPTISLKKRVTSSNSSACTEL